MSVVTEINFVHQKIQNTVGC